jgi:hypothetical protein
MSQCTPGTTNNTLIDIFLIAKKRKKKVNNKDQSKNRDKMIKKDQ